MLLVPISGKISLRNPPFVTIVLILLNCIIFFAFQLNDGNLYVKAEEFYFESGLANLEIDAYLNYTYTQEQQAAMFTGSSEKSRQKERLNVYMEMRQDHEFMRRLEREQIIRSHDAVYQEWRSLRNEYTSLLSKIMTKRYGFRPAQPRLMTLFSHMFLHGGFGHLLGNMIFLWLVGSMLEMGSGRIFYFFHLFSNGIGCRRLVLDRKFGIHCSPGRCIRCDSRINGRVYCPVRKKAN